MKKRKITVVTGTRAEYGLLHLLMKGVQDDPGLELQIVATGMHLSPEFGLTYKEIEKDGFHIDYKIEILSSDNTPTGICKSMGLSYINLPKAYSALDPDFVVLLGDRFETFCAASVACVMGIPIAHIHGGETTTGSIDEAFRHSITKFSYLHFSSTEIYRNRIIQLGEHPDRVFNVGALGVENIHNLKLLDRMELENKIKFSLGNQCILVNYHPVTTEQNTSGKQFENLLRAIEIIPDLKIIFTGANADAGGKGVNQMIDAFVAQNPNRSIAFISMGQINYLSALRNVNAVVGNSSSGIIEAPNFKVPVVNIGDRQKGRIQAKNVINCLPITRSIRKAVKKTLSSEFRQDMQSIINPYEKKNTIQNIIKIFQSFEFPHILQKEFYDLEIINE